LDAMAPGAAARAAARSLRRPARIALWGAAVIIVIVIIAAPLVHAFAQVVQAEIIGRVGPDPGRTAAFGIAADQRFFRRRFVAPGIKRALAPAARGALPLGFGGQPRLAANLLAQPGAVGRGVMPTDADDGLFGMSEHRLGAIRRQRRSGRLDEGGILSLRHRKSAEREGIHPDAPARPLVLLPAFAAHEKPAAGNRYDIERDHGASLMRGEKYCQTADCARPENYR